MDAPNPRDNNDNGPLLLYQQDGSFVNVKVDQSTGSQAHNPNWKPVTGSARNKGLDGQWGNLMPSLRQEVAAGEQSTRRLKSKNIRKRSEPRTCSLNASSEPEPQESGRQLPSGMGYRFYSQNTGDRTSPNNPLSPHRSQKVSRSSRIVRPHPLHSRLPADHLQAAMGVSTPPYSDFESLSSESPTTTSYPDRYYQSDSGAALTSFQANTLIRKVQAQEHQQYAHRNIQGGDHPVLLSSFGHAAMASRQVTGAENELRGLPQDTYAANAPLVLEQQATSSASDHAMYTPSINNEMLREILGSAVFPVSSPASGPSMAEAVRTGNQDFRQYSECFGAESVPASWVSSDQVASQTSITQVPTQYPNTIDQGPTGIGPANLNVDHFNNADPTPLVTAFQQSYQSAAMVSEGADSGVISYQPAQTGFLQPPVQPMYNKYNNLPPNSLSWVLGVIQKDSDTTPTSELGASGFHSANAKADHSTVQTPVLAAPGSQSTNDQADHGAASTTDISGSPMMEISGSPAMDISESPAMDAPESPAMDVSESPVMAFLTPPLSNSTPMESTAVSVDPNGASSCLGHSTHSSAAPPPSTGPGELSDYAETGSAVSRPRTCAAPARSVTPPHIVPVIQVDDNGSFKPSVQVEKAQLASHTSKDTTAASTDSDGGRDTPIQRRINAQSKARKTILMRILRGEGVFCLEDSKPTDITMGTETAHSADQETEEATDTDQMARCEFARFLHTHAQDLLHSQLYFPALADALNNRDSSEVLHQAQVLLKGKHCSGATEKNIAPRILQILAQLRHPENNTTDIAISIESFTCHAITTISKSPELQPVEGDDDFFLQDLKELVSSFRISSGVFELAKCSLKYLIGDHNELAVIKQGLGGNLAVMVHVALFGISSAAITNAVKMLIEKVGVVSCIYGSVVERDIGEVMKDFHKTYAAQMEEFNSIRYDFGHALIAAAQLAQLQLDTEEDFARVAIAM